MKVVKDFPDYTVVFHGAGYWEATRESHGPASQVAVFERKPQIPSGKEIDLLAIRQQQCGNLGSKDTKWVVVEKIEYPVAREEMRSKEQQLGDELTFHLRGFIWDAACQEEQKEPNDEEGEVAISISTLMQFDSVARLSGDIGEVTGVLRARGFKVIDGFVLAQVPISRNLLHVLSANHKGGTEQASVGEYLVV